jgi:uncharacterized protein (TIGR03086 family)
MTTEKTTLLPVSPDEAFALVTEPERLRRWQTVSARVDLRAGGDYRWTVVPGHVASGSFREVVPGRRVVFGWGWEGSDDLAPDTSTVTLTLEPTEGGTLVRLVHEGLTAEQELSHLEGWDHFLDRLERAAVTGDAGPDEWAAAPAQLDKLTSADATLAVCQHVLRGLTEADLDTPTPCSEFTVRQLVDHLVDSLTGLGAMAGGTVEVDATGAPEVRVADAAQQALEAWNRRGLEGSVTVGPNEMPADLAANILSLEFLIHAWDLAEATGQKVAVSEQVTEYVLQLAERVITPQAREGGAFAPAVEVGPDAHVLERLIAYSGRTPA